MKFEQKYPNASATDRFEFEYSHVMKTPKPGSCRWCRSFTRWFDVLSQVHVCSEECNSTMWRQYREDQKLKGTYEDFENHFLKVKEEMSLVSDVDHWKDIIIVVKDQLEYFKECVASVQKVTKNYHLYIWDNGSRSDTMEYIQKLMMSHDPDRDLDWKITTVRTENNTGFIYPNNELIALGESPYVILLNSDTKVFENWDKIMIGFLEKNPEVAQVGYWGGHLSEDGRGFGGANGWEIDYVPGWCFCINRQTYNELGLFSDKLKFAYCEDSDYSLRLKEAGKKIYALHAPLVLHYQNKTVVEVEKSGEFDLRSTFDQNHAYLKSRWKDYLENNRILRKNVQRRN